MFPGLFQSILKGIKPLMIRNMRDILGSDGAAKDEDEEDFEEEEKVIQAVGGPCCSFNP